MKHVLTILSFLYSISCVCQDTSLCSLYSRYIISAIPTSNENEYLIKVFDQQLKEGFDWGVIQNCYCSHYHFAEFHDSSLYIVKEFNVNTNHLTRELWKYSNNNRRKLVASSSLDYRVNSKQTYLAYTVGLSTNGHEDIDTIFIMNLIDEKIQKIVLPDKFINDIQEKADGLLSYDRFRIDDLQWATNSDVLWGIITQTCSVLGFFCYNCSTEELETFLPPKNIGDGHSLNPNTGVLVYSTSPFIFDTYSHEQFVGSGKEVDLFKYKISTGERNLITSTKAQFFYPKWICENILEYTNPMTHNRTRIVID